ncbi:MAG: hypothetical protein KAU83_12005, partial [Bacteroidales bacterium]|nr:hypothetical protein [Bacteroidales bacterium]
MKTEKCKMAFLFTTLFLIVNILSFAQEEDKKNVHLKVIKNNETTLDTSFVVDKDIDKEVLYKKINELTGIEMKLFTGFDLKHSKHGYKHMPFFYKDLECEDLDSLMAKKGKLAAIHKEMFDEMEIEIDEDDRKTIIVSSEVKGKSTSKSKCYTYIIRDKDEDDFVWIGKDAGVIMVIEDDDTVKIKKHKKIVKQGEEFEVKIIKKGDHEFIIIDEEGEKWIEKDKGGDYFIKKIKSGEEVEYVIMKKKGGKIFIFSDDEAPHHEKVHVIKGDDKKVYIITKESKGEKGKFILKEDMEFVTEEGKRVKVIVEDDEDGTIIDKKIYIMKVKEEGDEIEVIIKIEEGKEKKKEKEKKLKKS